jgi:CubicO group peptidase (beta-lactamase class C family)
MFNNKVLEKELNNIVTQLQKQTGASNEVIKENLNYLTTLLNDKSNKDKTPEEIIKLLFDDVVRSTVEFSEKYNLIPGINVSSKINNVEMNVNLGYKDYNKEEKVTNDIMFDIASSISKTYAAIIIYQLVEEGILTPNTKIRDILPELSNLPSNFALAEVTSYYATYNTDLRVDDALSKEHAEQLLNTISIVPGTRDKYNYNDMAAMILLKVAEKVTNKSYVDIIQERIIEPLKLENTVFGGHISKDKINLLTGSPNVKKGLPNDPKANIMGGIHGHAGIFASTGDAMKVLEGLIKGDFFKLNLRDFYTINEENKVRALSGQAIIPGNYYESPVAPKISTGAQGSTRTTATSGIFKINDKNYVLSNAAFTNSASINPDELRKIAKETNNNLDDYYKVFDNSDTIRVDIRKIVKSDSLDNIMKDLNKFELNVAVLQAYVKAYEPSYEISMKDTKSI